MEKLELKKEKVIRTERDSTTPPFLPSSFLFYKGGRMDELMVTKKGVKYGITFYETKRKISKVLIAWFVFLVCLLVWAVVAKAEVTYSDEQIATAIFYAENSKTHPYGILAHYKTTTPRQACINTIRHARKDWNGQGDFISFLGSRYCPVGASNDPTGLNRNWVRNVTRLLRKGA